MLSQILGCLFKKKYFQSRKNLKIKCTLDHCDVWLLIVLVLSSANRQLSCTVLLILAGFLYYIVSSFTFVSTFTFYLHSVSLSRSQALL